jgi:hypothetical protein
MLVKVNVAALASLFAPKAKPKAVQTEATATLWYRLYIKTKFPFIVNNLTGKLMAQSKSCS